MCGTRREGYDGGAAVQEKQHRHTTTELNLEFRSVTKPSVSACCPSLILGGKGRGCSFVAPLSRLPIDHAPLTKRSTVFDRFGGGVFLQIYGDEPSLDGCPLAEGELDSMVTGNMFMGLRAYYEQVRIAGSCPSKTGPLGNVLDVFESLTSDLTVPSSRQLPWDRFFVYNCCSDLLVLGRFLHVAWSKRT